jgi:hypothetical protein
MVALAHVEADREVVYDIQLHRRPPDALRSQFPTMALRSTGAQTALRRQVGDLGQLDDLLQKLSSVGVVLTDIHRLPPTARDRVAGAVTYEVRVAGELGDSLLRYLSWPHCVVPEQTHVRLAAGQGELHRFLQACTDCGTGIERVRRVNPAPRPSRAPREMSDA